MFLDRVKITSNNLLSLNLPSLNSMGKLELSWCLTGYTHALSDHSQAQLHLNA